MQTRANFIQLFKIIFITLHLTLHLRMLKNTSQAESVILKRKSRTCRSSNYVPEPNLWITKFQTRLFLQKEDASNRMEFKPKSTLQCTTLI
jgi:hypothetical protein